MEPTPERLVASGTKRCPFCAEEILVEAKKCRFCGEFLDRPPQMMAFNKDKTRWILAVTGSLLLLIAPFGPLLSAPIVGRITLFAQGKGDGTILVIAALAALGFSLRGSYTCYGLAA